jgi:hypothetical protein
VRKNGRLKFRGVDKLFRLLGETLQDTNWNVRRDTIALLTEVVSKSGHELEKHIVRVFPQLVHNLGDTKVVIRRGAVSAIETCYAHSEDTAFLGATISQEGVENVDDRVRNESLRLLEQPLVWEQSSPESTLHILRAVVGRLRDVEVRVLQTACKVLSSAPQHVGEAAFERLIERLPNMLRELYDSVNKVRLEQQRLESSTARPPPSASPAQEPKRNDGGGGHGNGPLDGTLAFGLVPQALLPQLKHADWEVRAAAVEQLLSHAHRAERVAGIVPHLAGLIEFLFQLMQDQNLKITLGAIAILEQLVVKVGLPIKTHLATLMTHHVAMLGDGKIVLRQAAIKLIIKTMQALTPSPVLELLMSQHYHEGGWRVREEIINVVIVSMSVFSKQAYDFQQLVNDLSPALDDQKSRVKLVALEAFAVIQNLIGEEQLLALLQRCVPSPCRRGTVLRLLLVRWCGLRCLAPFSCPGLRCLAPFSCCKVSFPFGVQCLVSSSWGRVWCGQAVAGLLRPNRSTEPGGTAGVGALLRSWPRSWRRLVAAAPASAWAHCKHFELASSRMGWPQWPATAWSSTAASLVRAAPGQGQAGEEEEEAGVRLGRDPTATAATPPATCRAMAAEGGGTAARARARARAAAVVGRRPGSGRREARAARSCRGTTRLLVGLQAQPRATTRRRPQVAPPDGGDRTMRSSSSSSSSSSSKPEWVPAGRSRRPLRIPACTRPKWRAAPPRPRARPRPQRRPPQAPTRRWRAAAAAEVTGARRRRRRRQRCS